jgi:hypothetical protein
MAVVQRSASSAEPTIDGSPMPATSTAIPSYLRGDSYQESQFILAGRGRTPTATGTYTGTVAYVQGGTPPSQEQLDAAVVNAATQRVERAGLSADAIPAVGEYYMQHGSFPELGALGSNTRGGAAAPPAGSVAGASFGMTPGLWIAAGGAALLLLFVLLTRKGGR